MSKHTDPVEQLRQSVHAGVAAQLRTLGVKETSPSPSTSAEKRAA